jgi:UDP-N-acetylglucosamine acyltransferase
MSIEISPLAAIDKAAQIAEGVKIGPFCVVGPRVVLHEGVTLHSHVVIAGRVEIGAGTQIFPFAALGHPPQDLKFRGEDTDLVIGRNNVIRENVTIHPGTAHGHGRTRIGDHCLIMNGAHIAHDCVLGNHVILTGVALLSGHCEIGDHVTIGGLSGVHQYCRIGRHAFIGGMTRITTDIIPFGMAVGSEGRLHGLNIIGLRRRGFSNAVIHELRAAYRLLFAEEGTFEERLMDAHEVYHDKPEVMEILTFIREGGDRPLGMPR